MGLGQTDPVSGPDILDYERGRIGGGTMLSECQKSARISVFLRIRFRNICDVISLRSKIFWYCWRIELKWSKMTNLIYKQEGHFLTRIDQIVKSDSARIKITKYNKCCIQNQDLGLGLGWVITDVSSFIFELSLVKLILLLLFVF